MTKITIDRAVVEQALVAMSYADACLKKQLTTKTKHEHAQDMLLSVGSALRQALEQPNKFHPDWDQIKPFNDRIAELEKVAKQALEALENFARFQRMMMDGPDASDKLLAEDYAEVAFLQGARAIPVLRQALSDSVEQPAQQEPLKDLMFSTVAMQKREHQRIERIVNTLAQVKQESADVDWVSLHKAADEIVRSKPTWKRFIDGTPLANDIACWMTDFALEYAAPHPQTIDKSAAIRIATALGWEPKSSGSVEWAGLTDEEIIDAMMRVEEQGQGYFLRLTRAIEAKLKEKNNG